jgi:predicted phosphohydrolase
MKVRYLSDLHLEFLSAKELQTFIKKIPPGVNEICILAGDIGNPHTSNYDTFMKFINNHFAKTFIIAGNHEYYNLETMEFTNDFLQKYFSQFENIRFLHNSYEIYNNTCFIGTTLWTEITNPKYEINDVYEITNFSYIKCNQLHSESVRFLENTLQMETNYPCVIITHHVPSDTLTHIKYKDPILLPYNQWFSCNMDDFIARHKDKIKCWIYGHTHMPSEKSIHNIPFLCNPVGYPGENKEIYLHKTIEL